MHARSKLVVCRPIGRDQSLQERECSIRLTAKDNNRPLVDLGSDIVPKRPHKERVSSQRHIEAKDIKGCAVRIDKLLCLLPNTRGRPQRACRTKWH